MTTNGANGKEDDVNTVDEIRATVEALAATDSPYDGRHQWIVFEAFQGIHGYFAYHDAERYTDPLTRKEWVITPRINATVGGVETILVAGREAAAGDMSPISFFQDRFDTEALGRMKVSSAAFSLIKVDLTKPFIEVTATKNPKTVDFSRVTPHELQEFTKGLEAWIRTRASHPATHAKEDLGAERPLVREEIQPVNRENRTQSHVRSGPPAKPSPVASAPATTTTPSRYRFTPYIVCVSLILNIISHILIPSLQDEKSVDEWDTPAEYDEVGVHLPEDSDLPGWDFFDAVRVATPEEQETIGNPPDLTLVEESILDPTEIEGAVREIPVPSYGSCTNVSTFARPNGSVRMLMDTDNPRLEVYRVQEPAYVQDSGELVNGLPSYIRTSEANGAQVRDLLTLSVCNPGTSYTHPPVDVDASLFIEFAPKRG